MRRNISGSGSFWLRQLCVAGTVALLSISFETARADEGGVSFWLPGLYGSLAAVPQTPGWSMGSIGYHTSVGASGTVAGAKEVQIGGFPATVNVSLNANLNAQADLVLLSPTYTFATPVLGGQLAIGVMGIFGRNSVGLDGTLTVGAGPLADNPHGQPLRLARRVRRSVSGGLAQVEFGRP